MNVLFVHRDLPGQFQHLAPALARDPANTVRFIAQRHITPVPCLPLTAYQPRRTAHPAAHGYLRMTEDAVLHGQAVARCCLAMTRDGFKPDIVIAHPGWGGALFIKDVFPRSGLLNYCEFYYRGHGADLGFDPAFPADLDSVCTVRTRNAHLLLSLDACDQGYSPTVWQRDCHPAAFRSKIAVVFDGIDTASIRPDPAARLGLPGGRILTGGDEIVTFAARDLEPYRGFPSFMRALPEILRARPSAVILIAGGDGINYGPPPAIGLTWREAMLNELSGLDLSRIHFLGALNQAEYRRMLAISSAHVYLTEPFVLSWSCMEALATGCVVVGSRTPPVQEVITDGVNGFLADFHSPDEIADRVVHALRDRRAMAPVRRAARETIQDQYATSYCLPRQVSLVNDLAGRA